jgi:ABC-type branched-subunit amino acid transport system substrate-binding protein
LPLRFVLLLISFVLGIPFYTSVQSQGARQDIVVYKSDVERVFQDALKLFRENRYGEASEKFRHILEIPEVTQRTSAAFLMRAKSLYHQGEYLSSVSLLRTFLSRFDKSEYLDDATYTLGLDFYQLEQYKESAQSFLTVRETSVDTVLAARAGRMLGIVAKANLEMPEVRALIRDSHQSGTRASLMLSLAEKVLRTGNTQETRELLRTVLTLSPMGALAGEAKAMLERMDRSGVVRIGVVLPLTFKSDQTSVGGLGQELLDGIHLATDEYNAEAMPKVSLEVRDSERDAGVAARQVSELSSDDQILAIMGPVFSNEVFAGAPLANRRGVPLITPTATASGIAAIGDYVFQANPDFAMRGRGMALYASQALGAHRFAVLSASDSVNKSVTEAFVAEVKELGGELVDVQWYSPGQTDLRDELAHMRRRGMELTEQVVVNFSAKMRPADLKRIAGWGISQQILDSLVASNAAATVESLFGEDGGRIADSLKIQTQRIKAKYDSLAYPVNSIDAIFVPIAGAEEIGIVSSQLRYFNFQTQLLGTGNWYDPAELEQNRQYASGIIFATDAYWQEIDQQYQQFAKLYSARFSKNPPVNAMIGYDSMKLLLRTIRQGATQRDEVMSALSSARPFQGVHSKIALDQGRVNACLTLLQFKGRAIKKVGEIDVSRKAITGSE